MLNDTQRLIARIRGAKARKSVRDPYIVFSCVDSLFNNAINGDALAEKWLTDNGYLGSEVKV